MNIDETDMLERRMVAQAQMREAVDAIDVFVSKLHPDAIPHSSMAREVLRHLNAVNRAARAGWGGDKP